MDLLQRRGDVGAGVRWLEQPDARGHRLKIACRLNLSRIDRIASEDERHLVAAVQVGEDVDDCLFSRGKARAGVFGEAHAPGAIEDDDRVNPRIFSGRACSRAEHRPRQCQRQHRDDRRPKRQQH